MPHAPLSPIPNFFQYADAVVAGIRQTFPTATLGNLNLESITAVAAGYQDLTTDLLSLNNLRLLFHSQELIQEDLLSVRAEVTRGIEASTQQWLFWPSEIIDEISFSASRIIDSVQQNLANPLDELVAILFNLIHPDLLSLAHTLGIEMPQIRQLLTLLLQLVGLGDPALTSATRDVAQQSEVGGLAAGMMQSLLQDYNKPDADEYAAWLTSSGPFSGIRGAAIIGRAMSKAFSQTLKTGGGLAMADLAVQGMSEGKVNMGVVDQVFWMLGKGRETFIPMMSKVISGASQAIRELTEPLDALMFPIFDDMIATMVKFVSSTGHVAPGAGFDKAKEFVIEAGRLGTHAHLTAVLFEMIPWVKHFGITQASALMGDMAAFAPIAAATWGEAIGEGVGRPSKYQINSIMRSRIPEERDLSELLIKRVISDGQFRDFMAFHGYLPEYVDALAAKSFRDPRLSEIIRLAQEASIDENEVFDWIRRAGFSDRDASKMLPPIMAQAARAERARLIGEVMTNLGEGFLEESEAEMYFTRLSLPPASQRFLFDTARLSFRRERITEHQKTLERAYRDGLMKKAEFEMAMSALGIRVEKVVAVSGRIETERTAKIAQTERADVEREIRHFQRARIARLKEQFELGLLDRPLFLLFLTALGLNVEIADEIVVLEELRLAGRVGRERAAEAQTLREQVVRFRTAAFVELFRREQINAQSLEGFLLQLGIEIDLARAIVEREVALKVPAPDIRLNPPVQVLARELRIRAKESLLIRFRKGIIDADKLLRGFFDLGIDAALATAEVDLEVQKRKREILPPEPPTIKPEIAAAHRREITDVQRAYVDGRVAEDTFRSLLSALVTDPDVLAALVEEALLARALKRLPAEVSH